MNSKSILAYFSSTTKAEEAARKLEEAGFHEVQIERIHKYSQDQLKAQNGPFPVTITGVADRDVRPAVATDPSFSGLSATGVAGGENILVTVVTPNSKMNEAVDILRRAGGKL